MNLMYVHLSVRWRMFLEFFGNLKGSLEMLMPETEKFWNAVKDSPLLRGFILVGGTALSMRISHRVSEDLDFICLSPKLPDLQIKEFLRFCNQKGFEVAPNDSVGAISEFEDTGLELSDYQRDFLVDEKVKLTFFSADDEVRPFLSPAHHHGVRIAEIHEIFSLKAVVSADRSKSRDWFDLYTLMNSYGFTGADFYKTFVINKRPQKYDIAMRRLTSGRPALGDEGYESLMKNPPTLEEMGDFFRAISDEVIEYLATGKEPSSPRC